MSRRAKIWLGITAVFSALNIWSLAVHLLAGEWLWGGAHLGIQALALAVVYVALKRAARRVESYEAWGAE